MVRLNTLLLIAILFCALGLVTSQHRHQIALLHVPKHLADLGRRLGAGSLLHGVVGESLSGGLLLIGDLLSLLGYRRQSGILSSLLLYGLCLDGHFTRNGVDIDWGGNR